MVKPSAAPSSIADVHHTARKARTTVSAVLFQTRLIWRLTVGDVVLTIPMLLLLLVGYQTAFVSPGIDASGVVASYAIVGTFLLANKSNSLFTIVMGISWERLINYHYAMAVLSVVLSYFHLHVVNDQHNLLDTMFEDWTNTTGTVATLAMIALVLLSFWRILRKYFFELWLYLHIALSVVVLVFCVLHDVSIAVLVGIWWAVDIGLRYVLGAGVLHAKRASLTKVTDDVVELRFPKKHLRYQPGQYVRVALPSLGVANFHAATISSAPHETTVTVHLKDMGGWSKRLVKMADAQVDILVEGPFGQLSVDNLESYNSIVLVCGGIGVTPMMSVARHCQRLNMNVHVVWAVRDLRLAEALPLQNADSNDDLEMSHTGAEDVSDGTESQQGAAVHERKSKFQVDVFYTRGEQSDGIEKLSPSYRVHHGVRPTMDKIVGIHAANHHRVAVLACGPQALVDQASVASRRHGGCGGAKVDFHEEVFNY